MAAMVKSALELAEDYLAAWKRQDIDGMSGVLHPGVHLESQASDVTSADGFSGLREMTLPISTEIRRDAGLSAGDHAMLACNFDLRPQASVTGTAGLISFEDDLIRNVEHFFAKRPFGRLQCSKAGHS
jgi:ketosteroid isomerase-like protein